MDKTIVSNRHRKILTLKTLRISAALLAALAWPAFGAGAQTVENLSAKAEGQFLSINADIILDSLTLKSNEQVFITPVVKNGDMRKDLPSLLLSGRNMHFSYQRGVLNGTNGIKSHDILSETLRRNGKLQAIPYSMRIEAEDWMKAPGASVGFVFDRCGCGSETAEILGPEKSIFSNPYRKMRAVMLTPDVTELPVAVHEGRARVQFEVDRTELHVGPYRCKKGQLIDNSARIGMIDDSVRYALSDPNVELAGISICGYASPESPYLHNEELANGRSKALAEYLADRYSLPRGSVKYSSVPENWTEFREEVEGSNDISESERAALLALIDAPASTPEDFDSKEKTLLEDPRFSRLYKTKIFPEWFPRLRVTTFAISTRLKPMTDLELARVLESTPEKMSLNQIYRVALLYPKGSEDFNRVIETALEYYPDDAVAIINAATAAIEAGDYARGRLLLRRAGKTPEAENLRGILATQAGDFDEAIRYFRNALPLETARENLELLGGV